MRALLICPDSELRSTFEQAAQAHAIRLTKSLDHYPEVEDLRRLVRVWAPDFVFVSIEDVAAAESITQQLAAEFASLQRVALSKTEDASAFRFALENRMAELLVLPFDPDRFVQMLSRLKNHLNLHPSATGDMGEVYAFVPAKGGVGASTIAANATWALSRQPGANVLLADLDAYSGVTGFMFGAEHDFSIHDAANFSAEMDDDSWRSLIKRVGNVDLLLSGAPLLDAGISSNQITRILTFARRTYSAVSLDLSDTFDERSVAAMREATKILLVTTPDLASLRLARMKALALTRLELEDKTKLLVNRVSRRMELTLDEIEASVGIPVFSTFPCDYADVTKSARAAEHSVKLAPSVQEFVGKLSDGKFAPPKRARFIERFAFVPVRYGFR
jgi:pilus assembly protein CpaE